MAYGIDEAKDQASFEYGDAVQEWQELPEETDDLLAHVLTGCVSVRDPARNYEQESMVLLPELEDRVPE